MRRLFCTALTFGAILSVSLGCATEETEEEEDILPTDIFEISVGPELEVCTEGGQKCMVVNGGHYYERIIGFDYEPGYHYVLRVENYKFADDEFPDDARRVGRRLLEVLEKRKAE